MNSVVDNGRLAPWMAQPTRQQAVAPGDKGTTVLHGAANRSPADLKPATDSPARLSLARHRAAATVAQQPALATADIKSPPKQPIESHSLVKREMPALPAIPASSTRAQPGKATAAAHVNAAVATPPTKDRAALCRAFLNELKPANVNPQRWAQVEKQLETYVDVTKNIQGQSFETLLEAAKNSGQVRDLMTSFTAKSSLAPDQHEDMTFRRDLWNIAMTDKPSNDKNKNALGCERSHARESTRTEGQGNIPDCLKPGKQLSITMRTPIQTDSGNIVDITVVSCVAPALDSPMQPEFGAYIKREENWRGSSRQTLNKQNYRTSFERIRQQVLEAAQKNPQAKTVALPAIGLGAFLDGLEANPRAQALQLATGVLADLVCDLRRAGKSVSYMDVQAGGDVWKLVDAALAKRSEAPLGYAGKVPGDWITKDTMLVNAWDPHSLVGNKLARDPSIDGYIGRSTLLHFMHGLHCAAHAAGVKLASR